jgi:hypothetical protein
MSNVLRLAPSEIKSEVTSQTELPILYNPASISKYFATRQSDVVGRALFVGKEVLSLASVGMEAIIDDLITSQLWATGSQVDRAMPLHSSIYGGTERERGVASKAKLAAQLRESLTRLGYVLSTIHTIIFNSK